MATGFSGDCDQVTNPACPQSPGNGNVLVDLTTSGTPSNFNPAVSIEKIGSPSDLVHPPVNLDIISINVSGLRFQTYVETLERFPNTLLGNPLKRNQYYHPKLGELFFDRHRASFEAILFYYQSNGRRLKRPVTVPLDIFVSELKYFEMGDDVMKKLWASEGYVQPNETVLPNNYIQRQIWLTLEHPDSSFLARILAFFSVFVIIVSTLSFCLETIPELKIDRNRGTNPSNSSSIETGTNAPAAEAGGETFESPFFLVEFTCMCWFTLEFALRFASSPSKLEFSKTILNIIDFVAIVPFYINLAWYGARGTGGTMPFAVLRIFRLVRVFRIFKLSRHSRGLQILGKTFSASIQELCLLVFFLCLGLVLFSSAMYIIESGEPGSKFYSIPATFWYVIITMTTVGYGDMTPNTSLGKLVGGACAIMGVLVLALPVPVIVANFKHYYQQERHLARMRAIEDESEADYDDDDHDSDSS